MKLRYVGGKKEKVLVRADPKGPRNVQKEVERDQLTQTCEGVEYHFPKPGAVLTVAPNIGGWLLGKHGKYLQELPSDPDEPNTAPNRIVAVVPEEAKKPENPPAKP
jgi:hypothetical protein